MKFSNNYSCICFSAHMYSGLVSETRRLSVAGSEMWQQCLLLPVDNSNSVCGIHIHDFICINTIYLGWLEVLCIYRSIN